MERVSEQISFYTVQPAPKHDLNAKRRWENGFQRWSNKSFADDETQPYGCCGFSPICDYCEDNSYGRPCVRALNEMCRESRITINYNTQTFENAWKGEFNG